MVNNELIKDDLYMAVNGDWLKTAKIPADKAATGGFYDLADDIEKTLMEDFANFMTGEAISDDKYLNEFIKYYRLVSNFEKRNADGFKPAKQYFDKITSLKDINDWQEKLYDLTMMGLPNPFPLYVEPDMKDTEVYAPQYNDGEKVALIRYPHGGTFEIPILTVNNKQVNAKKTLGNALDAVGINSNVAERLSGADFDGDTVMVIPTRGNGKNLKVNITSTPPLKELEGFDPKMKYGGKPEGTFKPMRNTQTEMGIISNLITDMTLKGASQEELARAVKHSMVVIDAEKHKLDYKQSEVDNGIAALKKRYQERIDANGNVKTGASTLISQAKGQVTVLKRVGSPIVNEDGSLTYKESLETYIDPKTGKTKYRTQTSTKMAEVKDAFELSSGTPQEKAYAEYANKMKALANSARKEARVTGKLTYSPEAKAKYKKEVDSLMAKLAVAEMNAPKERKALIMTNAVVQAKKKDNPGLTKAEIKKIGQQALTKARNQVGAKRPNFEITESEWEAIQAGAITDSKLSAIIKYVSTDTLKQLATPRVTNSLSAAKKNRIKAMEISGHTSAEIAEALGISKTAVNNVLRGKE